MTTTLQAYPPAQAAPLARGNAMTFAAVLLFAFGFPAVEQLMAHWGPIAVITVRIVLANLLLVPIWLWLEGTGALRTAPVGRGLIIGAVGFGIGTVLLVVGQWLSDAVTAALAVTTLPVFAIFLEVLLDGRRLTRDFLTGGVLVLLGGYLATGAALSDAQFGLGAAMGTVASAIFAWGSRAAVKDLPQMTALGQTTLTFLGTMLFCLACFAVFVAFGWQGAELSALDTRGVGMLLVYSWGAMAVSQLLWIRGISELGIGLASFHLNAVPFYVMAILFAMGGDWDWQKALGAVILVAGVVIAQRRG